MLAILLGNQWKMCLDNPKPLTGFKYWLNQYIPFIGWKVVVVDDPIIHSLVRQNTYRYNQYYDAESGTIAAFRNTPQPNYPNGFHVFPKKEDAETYLRQYLPPREPPQKFSYSPLVIQVKYKNAHTKGGEGIQNLNTIVATQIKFVKEPLSTKDKLIIAAFGLAALLTPALIFLFAWIIENVSS